MNVRALDKLLKIKARRIDDADKRLKTQMQAMAAAQAGLDQAEAEKARCQAQEDGARAQVIELTTRETGFRPDDIVTMQLVLSGLEHQTTFAGQAVDAARKAVDEENVRLAACRKDLQRLNNQKDQLKERRTKLAAAIDAEQEDSQDEESEEAAIARALAARMSAQRLAMSAKGRR